MIVLTLALIFWIVDPMLGVIMALCLPSVMALDTDGSYASVLVAVMLAIALYFFKRLAFKNSEGDI